MPAGTLIIQPRYRHSQVRIYIIDDHVGIVSEVGELIGDTVSNLDKDYQAIRRPPTT